jgi:low affinity Fe/Cu permease
MREQFRTFSQRTSTTAGSPLGFGLAVGVVVLWVLTGPLFDYSDSWQLVINTGTTIVTFLMVFLIQHTQNRDTRAVHLKLDELLRAVQNARTTMLDLEHRSDAELDRLQAEFTALRDHTMEESRRRDAGDDRREGGRRIVDQLSG